MNLFIDFVVGALVSCATLLMCGRTQRLVNNDNAVLAITAVAGVTSVAVLAVLELLYNKLYGVTLFLLTAVSIIDIIRHVHKHVGEEQ